MNTQTDQVTTIPQQALRDRLTAYTKGACFALDNMDFQDGTEKTKLQQSLRTALSDALTSPNHTTIPTKQYYETVAHFIEHLAELSQKHLNTKDIRLGEAYFAWQHHKREDIVSTVTIDSITTQMTETVVVPKMSEQTKAVFRAIRHEDPPTWFSQLRPWEQHFLKKITPQDLSDEADWSAFEKVLPATLRRFPGLANATKKTTVITNTATEQTSTQTSYRQGIPTAYDMPPSDYLESAQYNLQQMLEATQNDMQQKFQEFWGLPSDTNISTPVVFLGLLTHRKDANIFGIGGSYLGMGGKEDNTKRTDEKTQAIAAVEENYRGLQLIDLNIGVNWFRGHFLGARIEPYINTIESFLLTNKDQLVTRNQEKWELAASTLQDLKEHNKKPIIRGRNKNLFTAALCHHMANQIGGCAIPNCKSAKDRTAHELIMADAIEIYHQLYQALPQYDDNPQNRQRFVDVFVAIYRTRHHHKVANDNSPGSMGIKDEYMLDDDIVAALNADPNDARHTESKQLSKLNKSELSALNNVFEAVMYTGMVLGYPLVELWKGICFVASKVYDFTTQKTGSDVYSPIQGEIDAHDDTERPRSGSFSK